MRPGTFITISRYWNNPKISTTISMEGIALQSDLDDFVEAIIREIGPITWIVTEKQFREKVSTAVHKVTEMIKEESIKVV